jgi:hypothetical protein
MHVGLSPLELVWRDWQTSLKYISVSVDSHILSISLQYGPPHGGTRSLKATAFICKYDHLQASLSESAHGGVKSVVEEMVRDMGFREGDINKLEVIGVLLGDDGRQLMESQAVDGTTLGEIIEDELDENKSHFTPIDLDKICDYSIDYTYGLYN